MDCQGAGELAGRGYSLGYFSSLHGYWAVRLCHFHVLVAFASWKYCLHVRGGNDGNSPVVLVFVLALGSGFNALCTPTFLNQERGEGRSELLTFAFTGIVLAIVLVVFTFGGGFCGFQRLFVFAFMSGGHQRS